MAEDLIQWSYGTKLNDCSDNKDHLESCDGNCGQHPATKGQVELHNEIAIWEAKGVPIFGKPAILQDRIPGGFAVESLITDKNMESLIEFLIAKNVIDEEEFKDFHRQRFAKFLKDARERSELAQAKADIYVPHIGLGKIPGDGKLH